LRNPTFQQYDCHVDRAHLVAWTNQNYFWVWSKSNFWKEWALSSAIRPKYCLCLLAYCYSDLKSADLEVILSFLSSKLRCFANAKTWFFPRLQEEGYALRLFCLAKFFQDWYLFQKVSYIQSWCLESMEAQHKWWKFLLQYNGCYLDATGICISRLSLVLKVSLPNFNLEQAV
jgi:hypothetical protein